MGNNPASVSYVKSKEKACKRVGINGVTLRLTEDVSEEVKEEASKADFNEDLNEIKSFFVKED